MNVIIISFLGHADWSMIAPVNTISDDECSQDQDQLSAVESVSSGQSHDSVLPVAKKRRRRTSGMNVRDRLSNEAELRKLVGRKCQKCSQGCFSKFQEPDSFAKLLAFRETWAGLHKQDQDQVAACLKSIFYIRCVSVAKMMVSTCCFLAAFAPDRDI